MNALILEFIYQLKNIVTDMDYLGGEGWYPEMFQEGLVPD